MNRIVTGKASHKTLNLLRSKGIQSSLLSLTLYCLWGSLSRALSQITFHRDFHARVFSKLESEHHAGFFLCIMQGQESFWKYWQNELGVLLCSQSFSEASRWLGIGKKHHKVSTIPFIFMSHFSDSRGGKRRAGRRKRRWKINSNNTRSAHVLPARLHHQQFHRLHVLIPESAGDHLRGILMRNTLQGDAVHLEDGLPDAQPSCSGSCASGLEDKWFLKISKERTEQSNPAWIFLSI